MRRIAGPTAVPDLHGPGKNGFRDGNKPEGILATKLNAEWFNSLQEEVSNVIESEGIALDEDDNAQLLKAIEAKIEAALSNQYITQLAVGDPLPSSNIGPIWHAAYNSIMTWQVFNANGAAYTGYASVLVGNLLADTQPTPRSGYIKSGTANLNRTTYAALRGWAMHNGVMVAEGVWAAGQIAICDNSDGVTFKTYDVRAEFSRYWDDSRGIDSGRLFGSKQRGTLEARDMDGVSGAGLISNACPQEPSTSRSDVGLDAPVITDYPGNPFGSGTAPGATNFFLATNTSTFGVSRPRNVALLASIKF